MFDLKPLSPQAIPGALAKAERYRLLNESWEAESICLDILQIEPDHQDAIVTLLLALTDQFRDGVPNIASRAREETYEPQLLE
jgi:muramidase (phage lysozyme)